MSKVDSAIVQAVVEIDNEIVRLKGIKAAVQGKPASGAVVNNITVVGQTPAKAGKKRGKYRSRNYSEQVDDAILNVFRVNLDTVLDGKTVVREVKKFIPKVNPPTVKASFSKLVKEGKIERQARGRYILRANGIGIPGTPVDTW